MARPPAADKTGMDAEATSARRLSDVPLGATAGNPGHPAHGAPLERGQEPTGTAEDARHGWARLYGTELRVLQRYGWNPSCAALGWPAEPRRGHAQLGMRG